MKGNNPEYKDIIKVWKVAVDPSSPEAPGGGTANTIPYYDPDTSKIDEANTVHGGKILDVANPKLDVKMPYAKGKGGDGMLELAGEYEVSHATRQNQVITDHQANEEGRH